MWKKAIFCVTFFINLFFFINSSANNSVYHFNAISTPSNKPTFDFHISPNPANNEISIKFNEEIKASLSVYDGIGNQVIASSIKNESNKTIALNNLSSGIYFIRVKTDTKTIIKRFIKY